MIDAATTARFEKALPAGFGALRDLARAMATEGLTQVAVFHAFDSFRQHLCDAGRDDFQQAVIWRSMEDIAGWCSRSGWWFDHRLTKEEIDEYRKINA